MTIDSHQIEALREELHQLVKEHGFLDRDVLAKSRELDHLLNQYQKQHISYKRGMSSFSDVCYSSYSQQDAVVEEHWQRS
ncbi:aspartyl-phosphate phosphatase Spo0E family protein [Gorillibacterium timonense]|uniref:aspartyl-phosphate phosphatase Spo0E family protein n=1 Tax=Gorillibacterium timonense TaxID=1689269 RepID=UPI00071C45D9|nr:aspartyl-phosphate phosphatase Spo0E family protein [Gorillibacterium timonense]